MQLTPVKSGNIQAISHSAEGLLVQFHGGKVFEYKGVTAAEFEALRDAPSIGAHFAKYIRPKFKGVPA